MVNRYLPTPKAMACMRIVLRRIGHVLPETWKIEDDVISIRCSYCNALYVLQGRYSASVFILYRCSVKFPFEGFSEIITQRREDDLDLPESNLVIGIDHKFFCKKVESFL